MLTIEAQTHIRRPVHEVFAFLADFTHMSLWNYYINSVTQLTPGPISVGTVFDQIRRTDRQRYAITEFMLDQQVAVQTQPPARPLTLHFRMTPSEQGTQVIETWDLDTGLPSPLERLAQSRVQAAVEVNLAALTTLLETGEAHLPDGRVVRFPVPTNSR